MTLAALLDAGVDLNAIQQGIDSLGLPECRLVEHEEHRRGFRARCLMVTAPVEKAHRTLSQILAMIAGSRLSAAQQALASKIFTRLGEAEAKVHGTSVEQVHFHEVGAIDSIVDIVGAAIGWDLLEVDQVMASPVPTGQGFVEIAHGRCSIPAPATAELLCGVPLANSPVEAELTTPTGAAILTTLVERFGPLPSMTVDRIGYGAGQRDLPSQANILRLLVGHRSPAPPAQETVWQLETNLDDISGEWLGHTVAQLWEAGALDVYTSSIQMKKNRPGVCLTVLCQASDLARLETIMFRETTTLGIRRLPVARHTLARETIHVETPLGAIAGTVAQLPDGQTAFSPEFESCRSVATAHNLPLREVYLAARLAFDRQG